MITGAHAVIRTAEPDDAGALLRLYDPEFPRCALLDPRREPIYPTFDELREVMSKSEMGQPFMHAVEDKKGAIRGFCSLRALALEVRYGEIVMLMQEEADYSGAFSEEVFEFLLKRAFQQFGLNKVIANVLDNECAFSDSLLNAGFRSSGKQREVVYTLGRWHDVETFTLHRRNSAYADAVTREN